MIRLWCLKWELFETYANVISVTTSSKEEEKNRLQNIYCISQWRPVKHRLYSHIIMWFALENKLYSYAIIKTNRSIDRWRSSRWMQKPWVTVCKCYQRKYLTKRLITTLENTRWKSPIEYLSLKCNYKSSTQ